MRKMDYKGTDFEKKWFGIKGYSYRNIFFSVKTWRHLFLVLLIWNIIFMTIYFVLNFLIQIDTPLFVDFFFPLMFSLALTIGFLHDKYS
ncbi:hypothetical protein BH11PAT1_BH11PAT1_7790 [soil metagenome]